MIKKTKKKKGFCLSLPNSAYQKKRKMFAVNHCWNLSLVDVDDSMLFKN